MNINVKNKVMPVDGLLFSYCRSVLRFIVPPMRSPQQYFQDHIN